MFNTDVATGKISTASPGGQAYSTNGPGTVFNVSNAVPTHSASECYLWAIFLTCTPVQTEMLRNGTAILQDYIMIGYRTADGNAHYY
jgi:carboxypeptidase D